MRQAHSLRLLSGVNTLNLKQALRSGHSGTDGQCMMMPLSLELTLWQPILVV